jgi:hypothetical protein
MDKRKLPTKEEILDRNLTHEASMRDYALEILTAYTAFLLEEGYVDSDVYDEPPTAIDRFITKYKI